MNISQAEKIYNILERLPENDPFWSPDYTKTQGLSLVRSEGKSFAEWYTNEKQYHWTSRTRRDIIEAALAEKKQ